MLLHRTIPNRRVDEFVERYEMARARDGDVQWAAFLPDRTDAEYQTIGLELMRVDLECRWERGLPVSVQDYRATHADLLRDPGAIRELAFEEYRLRLQSGEDVEPTEYVERYQIDTARWPRTNAPLDVGTSAKSLASLQPEVIRLADAIQLFPQVGETFGQFRILEQLGEGSFGRVYLASQGELASRDVVLKITSTRSVEPDRLARLQHTNIVPIFSFHQQGSLFAICMPLLGTKTLADAICARRRLAGMPPTGEFLARLLRGSRECEAGDGEANGFDHLAEARLDQIAAMSFVEASITMAIELAEGLAHAHDRGVVHRDLKPANVLLTKEGRPMLLDFNVSDDTAVGEQACQFVGGTLPYMAPEHLRALETGRGIDIRSDVYSFGVNLCELLTGCRPIRSASDVEATAATASDTDSGGAVLDESCAAANSECLASANIEVRALPKMLPPDVASIISRCLEPDPALRYQSMHQVLEDLIRHQASRPLRYAANTSWRERIGKWRRRHPRLASLTTVGITLLIVIAVAVTRLSVQHRELQRTEAYLALDKVQQRLPMIRLQLSSPESDPQMLEQGREAARSILDELGKFTQLDAIPRSPDRLDPARTGLNAARSSHAAWLDPIDQQRWQHQVAELFYLLAVAELRLVRAEDEPSQGPPSASRYRLAEWLNQCAAACWSDDSRQVPKAFELQRDWIHTVLEAKTADGPSASFAERMPLNGDAYEHLLALELIRQGHCGEAIPLLVRLRNENPHDISAWVLLGDAYLSVGAASDAKSCYDASVALWPDSPTCYFHRGVYYLTRQDYPAAISDFDQTLARHSQHPGAQLNRGVASLKLQDFVSAERDFSAALREGATQTRVFFLRAQARVGLGDHEGAAQDRRQGMLRRPTDPVSCIVLGNALLQGDAQDALAWYRTALAMDPGSHSALRNIAHVLAERLGETEAAIEVIDRLVAQFGRRPEDLVSRGVLYARTGNRSAAISDGEAVLATGQDGKTLFQVACIYALCAQEGTADADRAIQLVGQAIQVEPRWLEVAQRDPDLASLRRNAKFRELLRTASSMQRVIQSVEITSPGHPVGEQNSGVSRQDSAR